MYSIYIQLSKDIIEITLLSFICYWWIHWLNKDKQKRLIHYFYAYSLFWVACFLGNLQTLLHCIEQTAPSLLMLFILIHQKTLQKNFISLLKIKPAQKTDIDWLQEILRFCLQVKKDVCFIIEHEHDLSNVLTINQPIRAEVSSHLLQLLQSALDKENTSYIVIDTQGNVIGINAYWKKPIVLTEINENESVKASYYLMNTHGLALYYTYNTRSFTAVIKNNIYTHLTSAEVLQSIRHYLASSLSNQGINHETDRSTTNKQEPPI